MPELNLDEETVLSRAGIADRDFADHSGSIQQGYQLGSLTEGLVAYYPMDEGQGQVLHDGALDNLGQINGASWNGSGQVGADSLNFDGTNDYVDVPPTAYRENSYTISHWVRFEDTSNFIYSYAEGDSSSSDGFIIIGKRDSGVARYLLGDASGSSTELVSSVSVDDGNYHHLVASYDNGDMTLYVDGSEVDTGTGPGGDLSGIDNASIGSDANRGGTRSNYLGGEADDVRVYDGALSQPEIEVLYNLTSPSGFVVEERDVPTLAFDRYGNNVDKALARFEFENDVTDSWNEFDGTDNTSAGFVDGVYGQAKDFDGSDDYVSVPDDESLFNPNFTVSHWIRFDSLPSTTGDNKQYLTKWNTVDGEREWRFVYNAGSEILQFRTYDGFNQSNVKIPKPATGEWLNILATHSANERVRLYVNGELRDEDNISFGIQDGPADIEIGGSTTYSTYLDGAIDDLRIYSQALSPTEVEQLFNKGAYRIKRGEL